MAAQLTTKELMYLTDFIDIEKKEVEKFQKAAHDATDAQCKAMFENLAQMHQNHFNMLQKHVTGGSMLS